MDNLISLYSVYSLYAREGKTSGFLAFLKQEIPLNVEVGQTYIMDNNVGYPQVEVTIQPFKDGYFVIAHKGRTLGNKIYKVEDTLEGLYCEIFDYYDNIYKAELKKIQKEEAQIQKESYEDLNGFGEGLSKLQLGKLQKTLNTEVYVRNPEDNTSTWMKRKDFIQAAVKVGGWKVIMWNGARILLNPLDKSFYPPNVLPQTCLDYFLYLNSKQG